MVRSWRRSVPKLQTLKPRLQAAPISKVPVLTGIAGATERIRGSGLQKIRNRILRRDSGVCRCEHCLQGNGVRIAHEVEHRVPLWAGGQEDDGNRYAINRECHEAKTKCEARMRSAGGYSPAACTCGRHRIE